VGKREPKTIDTKQISEAFALWAGAMERAAQAMEDLVKSPEFQEFLAKHYPPKVPQQGEQNHATSN
jgi:hypothetical protein